MNQKELFDFLQKTDKEAGSKSREQRIRKLDDDPKFKALVNRFRRRYLLWQDALSKYIPAGYACDYTEYENDTGCTIIKLTNRAVCKDKDHESDWIKVIDRKTKQIKGLPPNPLDLIVPNLSQYRDRLESRERPANKDELLDAYGFLLAVLYDSLPGAKIRICHCRLALRLVIVDFYSEQTDTHPIIDRALNAVEEYLKPEPAADHVPLTKVAECCWVSTGTLKRAIKNKTIRDYRKPGVKLHLVSLSQVGSIYGFKPGFEPEK